jgi:hypothetical protein
MSLQIYDEVTPIASPISFTSADTTVAKVVAGNTLGKYRVDALLVTNTDGIAHVVDLYAHVGAVSYHIGSVSVPAGQGTGGTPALDLLAAAFPATQVGISLPAVTSLWASMEVSIVTGSVDLLFVGGNF